MNRFLTILALCCFVNSFSWGQRLTSQYKRGQLLVAFAPAADVAQIVSEYQLLDGKTTQLKVKKIVSPQSNIWLLTFDPAVIAEQTMLLAMRSHSKVAEAQFNHILQHRGTVPNDSLFATQWQWLNAGLNNGTADADIDADEAWDITTGGITTAGDTIVVAVIDDGTDLEHPDLKANLWRNNHEIPNNGIDDDDNGYIDDYLGWNPASENDNVSDGFHGTEVEGMIGAHGNNLTGVTGINWRVKMMTIGYASADEADVIASYSYALKQRQIYNQTNGAKGAFVVATNSSWGIDGGQAADAPLWCAFYDTLGVHGILSCGATSNSAVNVDIVGDLPTGCSSEFLISVTASDNKDFRNFSAFGLNSVDVAAPGDNIYTTANTLFGSGYTFTSGTSFASPATAGLVALLYAAPCSNIIDLVKQNPKEAAKQIRDFIFQGVDVKPNLVSEIKYGGRINAHNSLMKLLASCGPCPKPSSLATSVLKDTSATVTWINAASTVSSNLRYRKIGASSWTTTNAVIAPSTLHNLQECTDYEFQVESICSDTISGWTTSFVFKTDGCCIPPTVFLLDSMQFTPSGQPLPVRAFFSWSKVLKAKKYIFQYNFDGGTVWTTDTVATATTALVSHRPFLAACQKYFCRVASICDNNGTLSAFSPVLTFTSKGCGACTDNVYCASKGSSSNSEWIKAVKIKTLNNVTGNDGGYKFFDDATTALNINTSYNIVLTAGFNGTGFQEQFRVWVDFNQDGDFNDTLELAFDPTNSTTSNSIGTVKVPANALGGLTRMRVSMKYFGFQGVKQTTCETFPFGEVEDYCISIIDFVPCASVTGLKVVPQQGNIVKLTWNDAPANIGYIIQYKQKSALVWQELSDTANTKIITGLVCDSVYEFRVKTICSNDLSDFSPPVTFKACSTTNTNDLETNALQVAVLPNPFSDFLFFKLKLPTATPELTIKMSDVQGRQVWADRLKNVAEGNFEYRNDDGFKALPNGIYFLQISTSEGKASILKVAKM